MDNVQPIAHIHVDECDFNIYISYIVETGMIHMFKYNSIRCDYEVFDNQHDACCWVPVPIRTELTV